jgi:hypothetical protein
MFAYTKRVLDCRFSCIDVCVHAKGSTEEDQRDINSVQMNLDFSLMNTIVFLLVVCEMFLLEGINVVYYY